jgi:hypothetical protein
MPADFSSFSVEVQRLHQALASLGPLATSLGTPSPAGQEWFDLLQNKLLAQLNLPPLLVVAVVGGTNIGKSMVFNLLAGEVASTSSPLAAGTKHPVCLVPNGLDDPALLQQLFDPFLLRPWHSADDPLADTSDNLLFWRKGNTMPPRLLLLDAPDVDSDVAVNWQRARAIRQAADVLVAILTQQKYNDAAVKQFFRAAVEADKPILVIFNQCDLEADRKYWPQWLATFCDETGARPELTYVIPYDRRAAESLRLPFYLVAQESQRPADAGSGNAPAPHVAYLPEPRKASLRDDLAALHFDAIKIRTFRGALRQVLDPQHGLPAYLQTIRAAAGDFSAAAAALSATEMARVGWPSLPTSLLVDEIRAWWDVNRQPWSKHIHGFYRAFGQGVTWPIRAAWNTMAGPAMDPLAAFQQREREAVVLAVEKLLGELERLAEVGNDTLRPRLAALLSGHSRATLLAQVQTAHENLPAVDEPYRTFLRSELDTWRASNPRAVRFLQSLDHAAALARPAISIGLFFTGLHFAGELVGQAATQAATQAASNTAGHIATEVATQAVGHTAGQIATEAAIAGGIAGGGEAIVSSTSEGVRQAAGRLFGRLQSRYAQQRAAWLSNWLEREFLGNLIADLRHGANVAESPAFQAVESAAKAITMMEQ